MAEEKQNVNEKLKSFTSKKHGNLIFVLGICGMALLLLSELLPHGTSSSQKASSGSSFDADTYAVSVQKELCELLGKIQGVGRVEVMLTLESTTQSVYATAEKTQSSENGSSEQSTNQQSYENDYVLVDGENGKEALVQQVDMPAVRGVVVICDGGDDSATVCRVTEAVGVVLGVSTNRICVTKMS